MEVIPQTASTAAARIRQQFLPNPGEQALKWPAWFNMFEDHLIATARRTSQTSGKWRYFGAVLAQRDTESVLKCVHLMPNTMTPYRNYCNVLSKTINNLRKSSIQPQNPIVLREFTGVCHSTPNACSKMQPPRCNSGGERLRDRLLLESAEFTLHQAQTIAHIYESATSECTSIATTSPSDSIQAIGTRTSCNNERGRSFSTRSTERLNSLPKREYSPRQYNSPPAQE